MTQVAPGVAARPPGETVTVTPEPDTQTEWESVYTPASLSPQPGWYCMNTLWGFPGPHPRRTVLKAAGKKLLEAFLEDRTASFASAF